MAAMVREPWVEGTVGAPPKPTASPKGKIPPSEATIQ
jgi:hypothetical protein